MSPTPTLDEKYMRRALELAELGRGHAAPNPLVGCVITYKGKVIGEGWHKAYGGPHAEVNAVASVMDRSLLPHATVYVTLEPCAHHGKTPPCADMLVREKVKRVVVALEDPNPLVGGKGLTKLKEAGIEVETGILKEEAQSQNRRFLTGQWAKRPYVLLKWAQTADGFIARENGDSKWISNAQARQWVHRWRAEESAILVGSHTVKQDQPALTVRDWSGSHPTRIVLDRSGSLSPGYQIFDGSVATRLYTQHPDKSIPDTEVVSIAGNDFLSGVLEDMYQAKLDSVLVEGGSQVLGAFIEAGLWDEARIFTAPHVQFGTGIPAPVFSGTQRETVSVGDNELITLENLNAPWRKN
ncbi:MAG: bifunctional diaminohydroxyphosphoribosylaminopyrimidine deaminase/5-amino-6-(5-phosphoribosylamino)uracil reductase RibD [Bacteroidota bacterium]